MSADYRRQLFLLLFVAAVILAAGMGLRDPWPADEPRFALIARDMLANGNWLFPRVGDVLYPDKPPVFFWLVAAFYSLTGSLNVAFLLPGFLAGTGCLLLVTDLARRLWDERTAIWCGATLLATLQFPLQMKSGQIDGLLCFWTTLALYGLARHLLLGPHWGWYAAGGVAAGIGIITKGVGFLPYLVFVPYAYAAARGWAVARPGWRDWRWSVAPAATLLVVGCWLVPMLAIAGSSSDPALIAYRDNILFHQTVTRYANSWGHIKPAWYLFTNAMPWLWLPVSLFLPWLLPAWWRDLKSRRPATLLLGAWILLVLLFFSMSDGKRSVYIFPAAPALALIAGFHARRLIERAGVQRMLVAIPGGVLLLLLSAAGYALGHPQEAGRWGLDNAALLNASLSLMVAGLLMLATVLICRRDRALTGFAVSMSIFWLSLGLLVAPSLDDVRSGGGLIRQAELQLAPGDDMAFVGWPEQFLLQWHAPVTHFGYRRNDQQGETEDGIRWLSASPARQLLLPESWLSPCFDTARVSSVGIAHRRRWVLADQGAILPACRPAADEEPLQLVRYIPPGAAELPLRSATTSAAAASGRQLAR